MSEIISTVLHQIDVGSNKIVKIHLANNNTDLEGYLKELLNEVDSKKQKRAYDFERKTTEFYSSLKSYFGEQDIQTNKVSSSLASRLLTKEVQVDERYGHLGGDGDGHVKKGSFLQFMYKESGAVMYLGVKVEHQLFLDEKDFKKKIGISTKNKIYKACKVQFAKNGNPIEVFVYDTNSRAATYWWSEFLELNVLRDDSSNTKEASSEVLKVLNRIKKEFPADYTVLRNSIISSFKQEGEMKYFDMLERNVEKYVPMDPDLAEKMPSLISKLKDLPDRKGFDTHFNLDPAAVSFKRRKYILTREIELAVEDGISNIDDKVWSEKTADGRKLVVIESVDGFSRFKQKKREV